MASMRAPASVAGVPASPQAGRVVPQFRVRASTLRDCGGENKAGVEGANELRSLCLAGPLQLTDATLDGGPS
jgi:hypothetical protein